MIPVSVVLPVYKGQLYLKDAIQSILSQSFRDFELIIVNDASPDDSESIVKQFSDPRIVYHKNETNYGLVGALNKGIELSSGKYIARMDQDDISMPDRLEKQFSFMEAYPDVVICGTQIRILGKETIKNYPVTDEDIRVSLLFGASFAHPAVMMRRDTLQQHGLKYDEQFRHAEDYGLWVQLSRFGKMANLPAVGLHYRLHQTQYTKVFQDENRRSDCRIREEYLRLNGIGATPEDIRLYHLVASRDIDYKNIDKLKEFEQFLERFAGYFTGSRISQAILKKNLYRKWKKWCIQRHQDGMESYRLFSTSPVSKWQKDLKVKFWFLKHQLFRK